MEKLNIAELLKDCPRGMELDCTLFDDVHFDSVDEVCDIIKCYIKDSHHKIGISFDKYGHYSNIRKAKCVIFPKGKTSWEGFQKPFKDGDIVATKNGIFIGIVKIENNMQQYAYVAINEINSLSKNISYSFERLATEEEKAQLFQAIKDNGYQWNEKTKTLEKLVKPRFKVGDRIKVICNHFQYDIKELTDTHYTLEEVDYKFKYTEPISEDKNWELVPDIKPKFKVGDKIKKKYGIDSRLRTIKSINNNYYVIKTPDWFDNCYIKDKLPFNCQDEWELVSNKFDINTLKPFDKVLVRCSSLEKWHIQFFEKYNTELGAKYPFICLCYNKYSQCIPYENNQHLLDTANDCNDFYKTWE